jgi:hypothetical protein
MGVPQVLERAVHARRGLATQVHEHAAQLVGVGEKVVARVFAACVQETHAHHVVPDVSGIIGG